MTSRKPSTHCWLEEVIPPSAINHLGTMRRRGSTVAEITAAAYDFWKSAGFPKPSFDCRVKACRRGTPPTFIPQTTVRLWLNQRFGDGRAIRPLRSKRGCCLDRALPPTVVNKIRAMQLRGTGWSAITEVANRAWKEAGYVHMPPKMERDSKRMNCEPWIYTTQIQSWLLVRFGCGALGRIHKSPSRSVTTKASASRGSAYTVSRKVGVSRGTVRGSGTPLLCETSQAPPNATAGQSVQEPDPSKNKFTSKAVIPATGKTKHRPGYRAPRVGEPRRHRMPLRLDKCSPEVKAIIVESRASGMTWLKTAEAASAKAGQRLSHTTVQRWYDLRIEQPAREADAVGLSLRKIETLLESILAAVRP